MKFESNVALPGEVIANDADLISQSVAEKLLDSIISVASPGLVDFGVRIDSRHRFYKTVEIHKLNAVFVI